MSGTVETYVGINSPITFEVNSQLTKIGNNFMSNNTEFNNCVNLAGINVNNVQIDNLNWFTNITTQITIKVSFGTLSVLKNKLCPDGQPSNWTFEEV